ncbi:hypothetical protein [Phycicoccus duodecadis]|uniref:hypothetical protein n=1 Tax=Phycicoccus duodecadis TaxID=173053 RepID=UPI0011806076|nr:hypothetical protein [Phycicoccus duodecadis]
MGAFVVAAALMGLDYVAVHDRPTERVIVISQGPSGTTEACGPRGLIPDTPGEQTTYRSADPPPGLPAEFRVNHCPDWEDNIGDVVQVRRTGLTQDDIYLDPIQSVGQWLAMAGLVGAATAVAVSIFAGLKEGLGTYRAQRRVRRRPG